MSGIIHNVRRAREAKAHQTKGSQKMTIYEFAKNLFENAVDTIETYTVEDATADIENATADGWDIPEDMTAEELCNAMNEIVAEVNE